MISYIISVITLAKAKSSDSIASYSVSPHIELIGDSECVIYGLKGICEYTKDRIKINMGKYCVTFVGQDLYINSFSYRGAIVKGVIASLEFESNG